MSENQKAAVLSWLTTFKETLRGNEERRSLAESLNTEAEQSDEREVRFFKIDAVIFPKTSLKPPAWLDHELLEKVFCLLDSKGNEDSKEQ